MKKIALLSYHFWYNYGTCLQAYALQKFLDNLGYSAEYLNFGWKYPIDQISFINNFWKFTKPKTSKLLELRIRLFKYISALQNHNLHNTLLSDYVNQTNNSLFDNFYKNYIKETEPITNLHETNLLYSHFIVGGDQVWNSDCCEENFFKNFLLDFVDLSSKKSSYGSSIGKISNNKKTQDLFIQHLSKFQNLSCREEFGRKQLEALTKRNVSCVLDPTLLLTPEDWDKITVFPNIKSPYLLCYILGEKSSIVKQALEIAQKNGFILKIISSSPTIIKQFRKYTLSHIGPCEFLGLINKCSYLITDSFHGTAFALNFNKPFLSFFKRSGNASESDNYRIKDLLSQFHLESQLREDSQPPEEQCNFDEANKILSIKRKYSLDYLKNIVEGSP